MLHQVLGHAGPKYLQPTAQQLGIELTGTVQKCVSCAIEKLRKTNIPKDNPHTSTQPGERVYIDITSMKHSSLGGRKHWALIVDEATKYKHSFFLKKKSDQVDEIVNWIKDIRVKFRIVVKSIRLDNSGENTSLEERCKVEGLGIRFEYTAPGTPQQNGVVERAFATLIARGRAMMNHAGFTMKKRKSLWCEAANTATAIDNLLV
jgi:transposase InsO family protein